MFANDYISRQIEAIGRTLSVVLFGKDAGCSIATEDSESDEGLGLNKDMLLLYMLKEYISEGKINEAENLLFEGMEDDVTESRLQIALAFYSELDKLSDSFLHEHNFSRQEIFDGLASIEGIYIKQATAV